MQSTIMALKLVSYSHVMRNVFHLSNRVKDSYKNPNNKDHSKEFIVGTESTE